MPVNRSGGLGDIRANLMHVDVQRGFVENKDLEPGELRDAGKSPAKRTRLDEIVRCIRREVGARPRAQNPPVCYGGAKGAVRPSRIDQISSAVKMSDSAADLGIDLMQHAARVERDESARTTVRGSASHRPPHALWGGVETPGTERGREWHAAGRCTGVPRCLSKRRDFSPQCIRWVSGDKDLSRPFHRSRRISVTTPAAPRRPRGCTASRCACRRRRS